MGDVHDEKLAKLIGYNIAKQLNKKGKTQSPVLAENGVLT